VTAIRREENLDHRVDEIRLRVHIAAGAANAAGAFAILRPWLSSIIVGFSGPDPVVTTTGHIGRISQDAINNLRPENSIQTGERYGAAGNVLIKVRHDLYVGPSFHEVTLSRRSVAEHLH
jgi:hypothetical protein